MGEYNTDIENLDKAIILCNKQMEIDKTTLILNLEQGLGDEIINHLNKQQKITWFNRFKQSFGYYIRMFFRMFG